MNVSTRRELQTLLDNIRVTQGSAEGSPLAYRVAWIALVATPLLAAYASLGVRQPYAYVAYVGYMVLLPIFAGSFYTIIRHKFIKLLRPILEAVLYAPEEPVKQGVQITKESVKATKARPSRGGKK